MREQVRYWIVILATYFYSGFILGMENVRQVSWSKSTYLNSEYEIYFSPLKRKSLDLNFLKTQIDKVNKDLFQQGFFEANISYELKKIDTENIEIVLSLVIGDKTNFNFFGSRLLSSTELKSKVYDKIKNDFGKVDLEALKTYLVDIYAELGFFNTKITAKVYDGVDKYNNKLKHVYFRIDEGQKIKLSKVEFRGNVLTDSSKLLELYYQMASELAKEGYYDLTYADNFTNILKKHYLATGFVYVDVSRPKFFIEDDLPILEYSVNEKTQVVINEINFQNVSFDVSKELRKILANQINSPLNIVEIENDIKKTINYLQSLGYYFAAITNLNSEDFLTYDRLNSTAKINFNLNLDRKICYNDSIINGAIHTSKEVISREIGLVKNDLITPEKIDLIRGKLSNLGLFSSLRITPYMSYENLKENECAKTNLIIQVKEKDFGLGEITPGYRTDLGGKIGFGISHNNLMNMNRTGSLKIQANKRTSFDNLDDERRRQNKHILEYMVKASIIEPYLLHKYLDTQLEFETGLTFQKKRYFSFDADVVKVSPQISKNFNNNLSTTLRYQFEKIKQSNATDAIDNDQFIIGSITPSITYDRRNDQINAKRGYYLNLSSEWANRYFGSIKDKSFEVNYVKIINRNRFYYPLGDFVFATALSTGFQRNFAEGFYIPNIKVFRLDGYDEIRGFEDGEINRSTAGVPIGDIIVSRDAYFLAFKFEPRYTVNDFLQLDVFYDAGRVFINKFDPSKLRSSVGFGFKILTQVGSLDFDYGVKLNRKNYSDGKRDATGRFHLSIGFF